MQAIRYQNLRFSDPREFLRVENWPMANRRGTVEFRVLACHSGLQRVVRHCGSDRYSPIARKVRIVAGSDGKTYVIGQTTIGDQFIMPGTMRKVYWLKNHADIRNLLV